jgi:hypothetical protein
VRNKVNTPVKSHIHKKFTAPVTLFVFLFSCLLPTHSQATQTIAPNLMIIFGNSYSMNRGLDDTTLPTVTPLHFNDIAGENTQYGSGTAFPYPLYGDQPSSKLYIAKQALNTVLNSTASNNINLGFATFRQTFGMEAAATEYYTRGIWPIAEVADSSMLTGSATTQQKMDYGNIAKNFKATEWYRIYLSVKGRSAKFGKGLYDYAQNVVDDSATTYMSGISNGLPTKIIYRPGTTPACNTISITDSSPDCSPVTSSTTTIHDQTYTDSNYGSKTTFNATGATGNKNAVSATNALVTWKLCYPYYNSQGNTFNTFYLADKDVANGYATADTYNTVSYVSWNYPKFDASGLSAQPFSSVTCSGDGTAAGAFIGQYRESTQRLTNKSKAVGNPQIYFSAIPNYFSGTSSNTLALNNGALSGWSGETTYTEVVWPAGTGTTSATYPSGVANPDRNDRQLITKGWQQTNSLPAKKNHMGVFLDLPTPSLGYVDNRASIKGFMGLQQMDQSGLDYDPTSQTIAGGKGIAVSTMDGSYNANQSPIYDSLLGALAYYTEYKKTDTFKNCRSNNILLFFDGKEDAHWVDENGTQQFLKPAEVAGQLLAIGVKTHVVILSNNVGDISAANAIAAAGGTSTAYNATSATSLLNSFTAVFSGLDGATKTTAAPAMPAQIGTGGKLYQAGYTLSPVEGHLTAYGFSNTGFVNNSPLWNAANSSDTAIPFTGRMTAANRASQLLSASSTGAIVNFNALDSVAFATTTPTVVDIINYTIDPSYNGGVYLAGRASGSFMGIFGDQSMRPIIVTPPANTTLEKNSPDGDPNFVTYKNSQSTRKSSVLVQNDDGYLYAFDAIDGSFLWGWMPRELVSSLKNYATFWSSGNMKGGIVIADAPTTGMAYASYVLGTAQGGALHYALKLKNTTSTPPSVYPDLVAWTNAVTGATSPVAQAPVVTYIASSGTMAGYANYMTTVGTSNTLYVHKIATGATATSVALPFAPSSELTVDNGYFYVADTAGMVWKMPVSTDAATVLAGKVSIGNTYNNQIATYVGVYKYNGEDYVWATSSTGITVFKYNTTAATWQNLWESHVGGAGAWDMATPQVYTADSSPVSTLAVGKVQMLPTGATITARSSLIKDALLLPVLVPDVSEPCAAGKAYLYQFSIASGFKPATVFYKVTTTSSTTPMAAEIVITNLEAGLGAAMSATVSSRSSDTVIEVSAEQTLSGSNGITSTYKVKGGKSGLISWREITN